MKITPHPTQTIYALKTHHLLYLGLLSLISLLTACPTTPSVRTQPNPRLTPQPTLPSPRYKIYPWSKFSPSRGPRNAPLQIVELLNPLHPHSRAIHALRKRVWQRYPGTVRWTIRWNPSLGKDRGYFASRALLIAYRIGSFWPYLNTLMNTKTSPDFKTLLQLAEKQGLNPQRFDIGLQNPTYKILIDRDMRFSHRLNLLGTPRLFINGVPLLPPYTEQRLFAALQNEKRAIQHLLQKTPTNELYQTLTRAALSLPKTTPPPRPIRPRLYIKLPPSHLENIPHRGPGDAPIQIIEFSDFACAPCRTAYFRLHSLLQLYPRSIRFFFKYYPIGVHRESYRVAELAAAAQDRRKFWKMYEILFREQKQVLQGALLPLARRAGLDPNWVAGELDRHSYRRRVMLNKQHGTQLRIRAVPTIIINGLHINGAIPLADLKRIVKRELWKSGAPQTDSP